MQLFEQNVKTLDIFFMMYYNNIISQPDMTVVFSVPEGVEIDYHNKRVEFTEKRILCKI